MLNEDRAIQFMPVRRKLFNPAGFSVAKETNEQPIALNYVAAKRRKAGWRSDLIIGAFIITAVVTGLLAAYQVVAVILIPFLRIDPPEGGWPWVLFFLAVFECVEIALCIASIRIARRRIRQRSQPE